MGTYNGCPLDPTDETKTKRWCSTEVDETGNHVTGGDNYGYCTKGCNPEIFPDEYELGSKAGEAASDVCDWTACNGFTLKADVFGKKDTYGQCQFPAGKEGAEDDYFCFVNADSNCPDKTLYDEEEQLFVTTTACKDPRAPLPRYGGSSSRRRPPMDGALEEEIGDKTDGVEEVSEEEIKVSEEEIKVSEEEIKVSEEEEVEVSIKTNFSATLDLALEAYLDENKCINFVSFVSNKKLTGFFKKKKKKKKKKS